MAVAEASTRPTCRRCGQPLDLFRDPDTGKANFECNNGRSQAGKKLGPAQTEAQFWMALMPLSAAERAELFKGIK